MLWLWRYFRYCHLALCSLSTKWWGGTSNTMQSSAADATTAKVHGQAVAWATLQTWDYYAPFALEEVVDTQRSPPEVTMLM